MSTNEVDVAVDNDAARNLEQPKNLEQNLAVVAGSEESLLNIDQEQSDALQELPEKKYEYLDHTSDVQIHAWGETMEEAFEQCAMGMFGYMTDIEYVDNVRCEEIVAQADDLQSLLFRFLDEFLFLFSAEPFFIARKVKILEFDRNACKIRAKGYGEPFDLEKHPQGTEVKAITYSNMQIHEEAGAVLVLFSGAIAKYEGTLRVRLAVTELSNQERKIYGNYEILKIQNEEERGQLGRHARCHCAMDPLSLVDGLEDDSNRPYIDIESASNTFGSPESKEFVLVDHNQKESQENKSDEISPAYQVQKSLLNPTYVFLPDESSEQMTLNFVSENEDAPFPLVKIESTDSNSNESQVGNKNIHSSEPEIHDMQSKFFCFSCDVYFKSKTELEEHQAIEHIYVFGCYVCNTCYTYHSVLAKHKNTHKVNNILICPFCPIKVRTKAQLVAHLERNHPARPKKFGCPDLECSLIFSNVHEILLHAQSHRQKRIQPFPLEAQEPEWTAASCCDQIFKTKESYKSHLDTVHKSASVNSAEISKAIVKIEKTTIESGATGTTVPVKDDEAEENAAVLSQSLKCFVCDLVFVTPIGLARHEKKTHNNKYRCSVCQMECVNSKSLYTHRLEMHKARTPTSTTPTAVQEKSPEVVECRNPISSENKNRKGVSRRPSQNQERQVSGLINTDLRNERKRALNSTSLSTAESAAFIEVASTTSFESGTSALADQPPQKVSRVYADKVELGKLQEWFIRNPIPRDNQVSEYTKELNISRSSKNLMLLSEADIRTWFDKARIICSRYPNLARFAQPNSASTEFENLPESTASSSSIASANPIQQQLRTFSPVNNQTHVSASITNTIPQTNQSHTRGNNQRSQPTMPHPQAQQLLPMSQLTIQNAEQSRGLAMQRNVQSSSMNSANIIAPHVQQYPRQTIQNPNRHNQTFNRRASLTYNTMDSSSSTPINSSQNFPIGPTNNPMHYSSRGTPFPIVSMGNEHRQHNSNVVQQTPVNPVQSVEDNAEQLLHPIQEVTVLLKIFAINKCPNDSQLQKITNKLNESAYRANMPKLKWETIFNWFKSTIQTVQKLGTNSNRNTSSSSQLGGESIPVQQPMQQSSIQFHAHPRGASQIQQSNLQYQHRLSSQYSVAGPSCIATGQLQLNSNQGQRNITNFEQQTRLGAPPGQQIFSQSTSHPNIRRSSPVPTGLIQHHSRNVQYQQNTPLNNYSMVAGNIPATVGLPQIRQHQFSNNQQQQFQQSSNQQPLAQSFVPLQYAQLQHQPTQTQQISVHPSVQQTFVQTPLAQPQQLQFPQHQVQQTQFTPYQHTFDQTSVQRQQVQLQQPVLSRPPMQIQQLQFQQQQSTQFQQQQNTPFQHQGSLQFQHQQNVQFQQQQNVQFQQQQNIQFQQQQSMQFQQLQNLQFQQQVRHPVQVQPAQGFQSQPPPLRRFSRDSKNQLIPEVLRAAQNPPMTSQGHFDQFLLDQQLTPQQQPPAPTVQTLDRSQNYNPPLQFNSPNNSWDHPGGAQQFLKECLAGNTRAVSPRIESIRSLASPASGQCDTVSSSLSPSTGNRNSSAEIPTVHLFDEVPYPNLKQLLNADCVDVSPHADASQGNPFPNELVTPDVIDLSPEAQLGSNEVHNPIAITDPGIKTGQNTSIFVPQGTEIELTNQLDILSDAVSATVLDVVKSTQQSVSQLQPDIETIDLDWSPESLPSNELIADEQEQTNSNNQQPLSSSSSTVVLENSQEPNSVAPTPSSGVDPSFSSHAIVNVGTETDGMDAVILGAGEHRSGEQINAESDIPERLTTFRNGDENTGSTPSNIGSTEPVPEASSPSPLNSVSLEQSSTLIEIIDLADEKALNGREVQDSYFIKSDFFRFPIYKGPNPPSICPPTSSNQMQHALLHHRIFSLLTLRLANSSVRFALELFKKFPYIVPSFGNLYNKFIVRLKQRELEARTPSLQSTRSNEEIVSENPAGEGTTISEESVASKSKSSSSKNRKRRISKNSSPAPPSSSVIDPLSEIPQLELWFAITPKPDTATIFKYAQELNEMPYRRNGPNCRLSPIFLQSWFAYRERLQVNKS